MNRIEAFKEKLDKEHEEFKEDELRKDKVEIFYDFQKISIYTEIWCYLTQDSNLEELEPSELDALLNVTNLLDELYDRYIYGYFSYCSGNETIGTLVKNYVEDVVDE